MSNHSHITRDIKKLGECHGCDLYHYSEMKKSKNELQSELDKANEAIKVLRDAVEMFCNDEGYSKKETSGHYLGQALSKVDALLGKGE